MSFIDWLSGNILNNNLSIDEYLYGTRHLTLWAICIISAIVLTLIFRKKSDKAKRILFTVIASVFLALEILQRIFSLIFLETYTVATVFKVLLPLYFCSIAVVFLIIAIFTKKQFLIDATTIICLLVTFAYMLFPAVGLNKRILTFSALYSIGTHALGFVTAIVLLTTGYAKFKMKDIWKTYLVFAGIVVYGSITSLWWFKGQDYIYMINNPLEFSMPIPYTVVYFAFLITYIFSFYIIRFGLDKLKNKRLKKQMLS